MIASAGTSISCRARARNIQVLIATAAFALSASAIIASSTLALYLASGAMMLLGIAQIISGMYIYRRSTSRQIVFGFVIVGLSSCALAVANSMPATAAILIAPAVAAAGFSSVISAVWASNIAGNSRESSTARFLRIISGALALGYPFALIAYSAFSLKPSGVLLGLTLLVISTSVIATVILRSPRPLHYSIDSMLAARRWR